MRRIINALKKYGFMVFLIKLLKKIAYKIFKRFDDLDRQIAEKREKKRINEKSDELLFLDKLCHNSKYKYIFVFYPYTEWNLPIFQRPQQIALELANRKDVLYFFCTANCMYDKINSYEKIKDNLYITTEYKYLTEKVKTDKRIIHLYSTDIVSKLDVVTEAMERNDKILYEYIDEIHEDITQSVPKDFWDKHNFIMKNEECYIVTTADKLYNDVKKIRNKNFILATNGVTLEDFVIDEKMETPEVITELKNKYDKLIGYYGALAKWFDYELLDKVAKKYPNYAIVLIGLKYDDSLEKSKILDNTNVYYLGKVEYKQLINYSSKLDLLTIPFLINEITESTSPVKLFEYMATQKPILTTAMKECKKYKSVNIANSHEEFIEKIPEVLKLENDEEYKKILMKEAKDNTWKQKSEDIIALLGGESKK